MSRITRRTIIPVNQITPLTYRDGVTYIQLLTELSDYIKTILHPSLQHTVDQLVADVETQMDKHHDQYVDGVQEFQRIHDAFMSDVNANLIALNDGAVSDLVKDDTSLLGRTLRDIFTDRESFTNLAQEIDYQIGEQRQNVEHHISVSAQQIQDHKDHVDEHFLHRRSRGVFTAADFGIQPNTTTPQDAIIQTALDTAAAAGVPLVLDYQSTIYVENPLRIPENTTLDGNGSTLVVHADDSYVLEATGVDNVHLSNFTIDYEVDTNHLRGILFHTVNHGTITNVHVTSPYDDTGYFNRRANALNFVGCQYIEVSRCQITKWAWSMWVEDTHHSTFRDMHITGYRRGVHVWDASNNVFDNILVEHKSPESDHSPGYNGFLIEAYSHGATHTVTFTDCVVRDAGEHGIRIGGAHLVKNITFNNCEVRNVGRCGYKVMGGTYANANFHEDITFNNCRAIDGGLVRGNAYGFALHMVRNCRIIQPYVAAENQVESFVDGFSFQGVSNIYVSQPVVRAWENKAIHIGAAMGSCENIVIDGGSFISSTGKLGIHFEVDGVTMRKLMIVNHPIFEIHPQGTVYHQSMNSSSRIAQTCVVSFMVPNPTYSRLISSSSTGQNTVLDIIAPREPVSNSQFLAGSRWVDNYHGNGVGTKKRSGWVWE